MEAEEDRSGDVGVQEIGDPGQGRIKRAQCEQHDSGGARDQRDREEVHHDQAQQEQVQVDQRRERERRRDVLSPGEVRGARSDEHEREEPEREGGRVEDVHVPPLAVPAHELLTEKPDRDHQELQVEPIVPEPEEEVDAEDDGEGPEAEHVLLTPRPREQHVEDVGEHELRGQQHSEVVDGSPVPSPVGKHRDLDHRLHVVLRPKNALERPAY